MTPTTSSVAADSADLIFLDLQRQYQARLAEGLPDWTVPTYRPFGPYPPAVPSALDSMSQFEEDVSEVLFEMQDVLVSKQKDYGPAAINDSPEGPLTGINVRMHDKMSRAQNLRRNGVAANHESLRDTYVDLANYAVIAVMLLDGTWPA